MFTSAVYSFIGAYASAAEDHKCFKEKLNSMPEQERAQAIIARRDARTAAAVAAQISEASEERRRKTKNICSPWSFLLGIIAGSSFD